MDPLGESVSVLLKSYYRKELKLTHRNVDVDQLINICSIPIQLLINTRNRAWDTIQQHNIDNLFSLQHAIALNLLPRSSCNNVLKALPGFCSMLVRQGQAIDTVINFPFCFQGSFVSLTSLKPIQIKSELTNRRIGPMTVDPKTIYKDPTLQLRGSPSNVWMIKNPTLRNVRLKVLYKDIFSNERRHRFGITQSPNCPICQQVESIQHQLVECRNANRLWRFFRNYTQISIGGLSDLIAPTNSMPIEIVKSVILRKLIQIDRSSQLDDLALRSEVQYFLRIEALTNPRVSEQCNALIQHISSC